MPHELHPALLWPLPPAQAVPHMPHVSMSPRRFLKQVEDAYLPNPYHSKTHAADVLQTLHVCVTRGGMLGSGYADPLAQLAAYFAAVIHDVNHLVGC